MADRFGETPALGDGYLVVGPVVKKSGSELTLVPGESASSGGKPSTLVEGDTLNAATLVSKVNANAAHAAKNHGIIFSFTVKARSEGRRRTTRRWPWPWLPLHADMETRLSAIEVKVGGR